MILIFFSAFIVYLSAEGIEHLYLKQGLKYSKRRSALLKSEKSFFAVVLFLAAVTGIFHSPELLILAIRRAELSPEIYVTLLDKVRGDLLVIFMPLIAASFIFSLVEILIARSISKKISTIFGLFRPVCLASFLILSFGNLSSMSLGLLKLAP